MAARVWRRKAEPVGEVLGRWIERSGVLNRSDRDRVWQAWRELLGSEAEHTQLVGLRNHVATFIVDSSPLLSELNNFRKQELLEGLRERVRSTFVRDLRFRLQKSTGGARKR